MSEKEWKPSRAWVSLDPMRNKAYTVRAFAFLRWELEDIGIVVNHAKTIALPPIGYAPTAEETSPLESVDVRIEGDGGATVVGVSIGTDEYVPDRAIDVVRNGGNGGTDHLARCLPCRSSGRWPLSPSNRQSRGRASWKNLDTGQSLEACRKADNGSQSA